MYLVIRKGKILAKNKRYKTGLIVDLVSYPTTEESLWSFSYLDKDEEQFKYDAIKGVLLSVIFPMKLRHQHSGLYLSTFFSDQNVQ